MKSPQQQFHYQDGQSVKHFNTMNRELNIKNKEESIVYFSPTLQTIEIRKSGQEESGGAFL